MTFKWLTVPFTNRTKQVEAVQLWEVRWWAVKNRSMFNDTHDRMLFAKAVECVEAFTSQAEAQHYAEALTAARALVHDTGSHVGVTVTKRDGR